MNILSLIKKLSAVAVILSLLYSTSCANEGKPQFTIEGKVENAGDSLYLYLEKRSLTGTSLIDSVKPDSDGHFKIMSVAPEHPEFYLLELGGQKINLAVDSTETIEINASKETFATDYTLKGSVSSEKIRTVTLAAYKIQNRIRELTNALSSRTIAENQYLENVKSITEEYKTEANAIIQNDYGSLAAYYAVFQKVGDFLIYDPSERGDLKIFQAIANTWKIQQPEHPRTENLEEFVLAALRQRVQIEREQERLKNLEITDISEGSDYFEIALPDVRGKDISLSSLKGKLVILDFTIYQADYSPARNIYLKKVYEQYKDKIAVYQVSFDMDRHQWQNAAVNLPWTCVWDKTGPNSDLLDRFNLQGFPTTFIVDSKGNIVRRLSGDDNLMDILPKIL